MHHPALQFLATPGAKFGAYTAARAAPRADNHTDMSCGSSWAGTVPLSPGGRPPAVHRHRNGRLKKCSSRHFGSHFGSHRKRRCRGPRVQGLLCPLNPRREHAQSTRRPRDEPCMPHLSVTKPASPPWVSMSAHTTSSGICDVVARPHQAVVASRSWPGHYWARRRKPRAVTTP